MENAYNAISGDTLPVHLSRMHVFSDEYRLSLTSDEREALSLIAMGMMPAIQNQIDIGIAISTIATAGVGLPARIREATTAFSRPDNDEGILIIENFPQIPTDVTIFGPARPISGVTLPALTNIAMWLPILQIGTPIPKINRRSGIPEIGIAWEGAPTRVNARILKTEEIASTVRVPDIIAISSGAGWAKQRIRLAPICHVLNQIPPSIYAQLCEPIYYIAGEDPVDADLIPAIRLRNGKPFIPIDIASLIGISEQGSLALEILIQCMEISAIGITIARDELVLMNPQHIIYDIPPCPIKGQVGARSAICQIGIVRSTISKEQAV